nr:macrolide 2'-phosphotransferase [Knoellia sp. DB2414S]
MASAAVPGLDPASVEALPGAPDHHYDVAFVQDTQHRRWVVRVPRSQAASAQMESTFSLLTLLARRLPFSVPVPKGYAALKEGGRAAIYPYLPGQNLDFSRLPGGPGLAAELGRAIAALHNADHQLFDEAGMPAYDADTYRTRRLSELDRAAATGHVPTTLLSRWERQLEDVTLWRFAPTPTHGDLTGDQVLVVFDGDDASTGRVKAFTGWEDAKVADPADDFAALVAEAPEGAVETVLEAYAHARSERPDPNLLQRARLSGEMQVLSALMTAVAGGDRLLVERHSVALRRLDDRVHEEEAAKDDYRRDSITPARPKAPVAVPPVVVDDEDDDAQDDVEVMFAPTAAGPDEPDAPEKSDRAERSGNVDRTDEADRSGEADQSADHSDEVDHSDVGEGSDGAEQSDAADRSETSDHASFADDTSRAGGGATDGHATQEIPQGGSGQAASGATRASDEAGEPADDAPAEDMPADDEPTDDAPADGDPVQDTATRRDELPRSSAGAAEVTTEIDLESLRVPPTHDPTTNVQGEDPGPEFEPGYRP